MWFQHCLASNLTSLKKYLFDLYVLDHIFEGHVLFASAFFIMACGGPIYKVSRQTSARYDLCLGNSSADLNCQSVLSALRPLSAVSSLLRMEGRSQRPLLLLSRPPPGVGGSATVAWTYTIGSCQDRFWSVLTLVLCWYGHQVHAALHVGTLGRLNTVASCSLVNIGVDKKMPVWQLTPYPTPFHCCFFWAKA